jgi:hypothetical protein
MRNSFYKFTLLQAPSAYTSNIFGYCLDLFVCFYLSVCDLLSMTIWILAAINLFFHKSRFKETVLSFYLQPKRNP